jgi:hypothetical protein
MDDTLKAVLDELHHYGAEHDAGRSERLERLRNVEPDSSSVLACASWSSCGCRTPP